MHTRLGYAWPPHLPTAAFLPLHTLVSRHMRLLPRTDSNATRLFARGLIVYRGGLTLPSVEAIPRELRLDLEGFSRLLVFLHY